MTKNEKIWLTFILVFMVSVIFCLGYKTGKDVRSTAAYPDAVQKCLSIKNAYVLIDNDYGMRCFEPSKVVPLQ